MSSLKQVIYNALYKIATPDKGAVEVVYETPEAARDDFIAKVMAELFPEDSSVVTVPTVVEKTPKKTNSPKKSPEEKVAEKEAKEAAKAAKAAEKEAKEAAEKAEKPAKSPKKSPEEKAAEKEAAKVAKEAEKEAAKAAKAAEKEAAKAAKAAEKEAAKAAKAPKSPAAEVPLPASPAPAAEPAKPVKQRVKPGPKPKPVIEGANIQKIDPTWRKHLKAAAKTAGKEHSKEMEAELLTFLNGMDKAAFDGAKAEEHVRAFLTPSPPMTGSNAAAALHTPPRAAEPEDVDAIEVEFKGKTYFVDPASKRVYEQDGEVSRGVGYVGMAAFADMEMPETE